MVEARGRRSSAPLVAVVLLLALLGGALGVHAACAAAADHGSMTTAMRPVLSTPIATGAEGTTPASSRLVGASGPSGGAHRGEPADCLLVGMLCVLGVAAMTVLLLLAAGRSRSPADACSPRRSPAIGARHQPPRRPPSLLVLSVCRT